MAGGRGNGGGRRGSRSWSEALLIMMAPAIKLRNGLGLAWLRFISACLLDLSLGELTQHRVNCN